MRRLASPGRSRSPTAGSTTRIRCLSRASRTACGGCCGRVRLWTPTLWTKRARKGASGVFRIEKRAVQALWKRDAPRDLPVYPEVPYAFFGFQPRLAPHLPPTRRSVSSGLPYSAAWGDAKVNRALRARQQINYFECQATRWGLDTTSREAVGGRRIGSTKAGKETLKCAKS